MNLSHQWTRSGSANCGVPFGMLQIRPQMSSKKVVALVLSVGCLASTLVKGQSNYYSLRRRSLSGSPMFTDVTQRVFGGSSLSNPVQLNYGIAVTDVDNDGEFEIVVAGYDGPNLVLKYNKETSQLVNIAVNDPSSPYYNLRDPGGNAIGVAACDIDGDGNEEIYFLNTNQAYSGMATYSDKLFKLRNGKYEDILSDGINRNIASYFAGRSVACVDRNGSGRYAIYLANYARGNVGPHSLIEMDPSKSDIGRGVIALRNVGPEVGIAKFTGGRGVTIGPILNDNGRSDIFCDNENGPNFLFKNRGDGTFQDVAGLSGINDSNNHGRGLALADFNEDGNVDIVYGNWNGPHRLFIQEDVQGVKKFRNVAEGTPLEDPSPIRTVIAADFDNDGLLEVFFNNIAYRGAAPNRIFKIEPRANADPSIVELDIGDASEPQGRGTGGAVTDFDGDGKLELIVSHGESARQPLSIYKVGPGSQNAYLRVIPKTQFGAPARGARVVLITETGRRFLRVIDGGSGYLCQMEPVAHFGLGTESVASLEITWPDTSKVTLDLRGTPVNRQLIVEHPNKEMLSRQMRQEL
ncbi:cartilage acidic protein 1-like isoform X2 [Artemia franciscana]